MRNRSVAGVALAMVLAAPASWAVVYDPSQKQEGVEEPAKSLNPEAQAALEAGIAALKEADAAGDAGKKSYTNARKQFEKVTKKDPNLPEGWNGLGYSQRKLGDPDSALKSYARALALQPGYPEATEYRGEAYLGLNRIEDAKQAYLDLFAGNRALADRLLAAMKSWIEKQKADSPDAVDLAKWVEERAQIAAQTASLTREGVSAEGWAAR